MADVSGASVFTILGEPRGFGDFSSEERLLLSLETIDCNAALAGDDLETSEEGMDGSNITCTAFAGMDRGGSGGGTPERGTVVCEEGGVGARDGADDVGVS